MARGVTGLAARSLGARCPPAVHYDRCRIAVAGGRAVSRCPRSGPVSDGSLARLLRSPGVPRTAGVCDVTQVGEDGEGSGSSAAGGGGAERTQAKSSHDVAGSKMTDPTREG